jgi:hypothetical protein
LLLTADSSAVSELIADTHDCSREGFVAIDPPTGRLAGSVCDRPTHGGRRSRAERLEPVAHGGRATMCRAKAAGKQNDPVTTKASGSMRVCGLVESAWCNRGCNQKTDSP